ncbi:MAG: HK97 gp10 family phage protein [Fusobacteriaceae bacterium]
MDELNRALKKISNDFPVEVGKFMTRQALKVERYTKLKTPVDTGTLRASWGHIKGKEKFERIIYSKTDYAVNVEFDGVKRNKKGSFMLKQGVEKMESEFEKDVNKLIRKVLG